MRKLIAIATALAFGMFFGCATLTAPNTDRCGHIDQPGSYFNTHGYCPDGGTDNASNASNSADSSADTNDNDNGEGDGCKGKGKGHGKGKGKGHGKGKGKGHKPS